MSASIQDFLDLKRDIAYAPTMDWESIIHAYPAHKNVIIGVRALRERIEGAIAAIPVPNLSKSCREMPDLSPFAPLLAPSCERVWEDITGAKPAFGMAEALAALTMKGDVPEMEEEDRERLEAIAQNAFSRFLFLLREKNGHLVPTAWNKGDCPFCGEYARIGFDEENRRTLHCLTCGHSWRFPRIKCPSCGNADHTSLGYFEAEGIDGVRVYFCKECRRYIKVVDTKARTAHDAETEDALTLELDEIAKKEDLS
ncbi:MAG TPA: formate dehydrogenase accessory protein FdhE [Deltaproteobacteria bacterium]|nr:formate dehydrogenase accessory protein FdhE [Deltaproteobacteria bacterium]HPR56170.1 formate dehydrogenase accessory protein FdhE [Deltaproteobacteria bacterium]